MPRIEPPANDAFVCEQCGYVLEGIGDAAACPECGRPAAESLPERRTGSAWQRSRPAGWLTTSRAILTRPVRSWDDVRPEVRSSLGLWTFNACVTAAIPASLLLVFGGPVLALKIMAIVVGVVALLMAIEYYGVRFFGTRRGWRINRAVATAVVGHASIGWVIGGLAHALGIIALLATASMTRASRFDITIGPIGPIGAFDIHFEQLVTLYLPALVGLLAFEVLVYLGMREMRFANGKAGDRRLEAGGEAEPDARGGATGQ